MRPTRTRRLLAPLAGVALTASLLAACGGGSGDPPAEETTTTEESEQTGDAPTGDGSDDGGAGEDDTDEDDSEEGDSDGDDTGDDGTGDDSTGDDGTEEDDGADDGTGDDGEGGTDAPDEGGEGSTDLFEGTWGFGHDEKVLSAEELADLLEEKAEEQGPDEMSLDVECESGIDTAAEQDEADCTAFADEGAEHGWHVTAGPADAGLEVQVENVD